MHRFRKAVRNLLFVTSVGFLVCPVNAGDQVIRTEEHDLRIIEIARGLEHPWATAFLPDRRMLVTERPGRHVFVARRT